MRLPKSYCLQFCALSGTILGQFCRSPLVRVGQTVLANTTLVVLSGVLCATFEPAYGTTLAPSSICWLVYPKWCHEPPTRRFLFLKVRPVPAIEIKFVGGGQTSVGGTAGVAKPVGVGGVASEDTGCRKSDLARGSAVGFVQGSQTRTKPAVDKYQNRDRNGATPSIARILLKQKVYSTPRHERFRWRHEAQRWARAPSLCENSLRSAQNLAAVAVSL